MNLNKVKYRLKFHENCLIIALALLTLGGCSSTEKVAMKPSDINCAFLASDCSLLKVGAKDQTGLRYINSTIKWNQYSKILIDPVTFWAGNNSKISASDQQMLVNYFFQQLKEQLGTKFELVNQSGPGVMKLDVAMTDVETATPVLRSISMIVPQAHMIANLKYLATGSMPFVGSAQAEAKLTDSISGEVLALAVDKRIGGGSFTTGFQWQWGDTEHAIDHWAELLATKLSSWTSGKEVAQ